MKSKRLHAKEGLHIDAQLDLAEHIVAYMVHEFGSEFTEALLDRIVDKTHGSQPSGSEPSNGGSQPSFPKQGTPQCSPSRLST